jgi:WD40 repeat protein
MMQIDNDNLLCWSNEPSIEQVFVICNLKKSNNKLASTISYVIDAETIDKSVVLKRDDGVTFLRPLKVWEHDNCIAITHSDFMVTIWQWSYERQELKLISKLSGHTSIVCDIEQLANDNYVTISLDKTVRIWDYNNQLSGSCYCKSVFMGDYAFTSLYLCKFTNTVIVGDKMGNVHWFNVN